MTPRYRSMPPALAHRVGVPFVLAALAMPAFAGPSALEKLADAETWVERARARDALWTTALTNLRAARGALADGREAEAAALADEAAELARLGLQQRERVDMSSPR